jgi:hypothetical protein
MSVILSEQKRQIFLRGKRLFVATLSLPPARAGAYCVVDHADGRWTFLKGYVIIVHRLAFAHIARQSPTPWSTAAFRHELDAEG